MPPYKSMYFLLILLTPVALGRNILILIDLPSYSHHSFNYALAVALIERGHNVTMAGPYSHLGKSINGYHPIMFEGVLFNVKTIETATTIEEDFTNMNVLRLMKEFVEYPPIVCQSIYNTNGFKTLLNYPQDFKFDLIIIDMSLSSCLYPFIQRFNYPPTVGTTTFLLPPFLSEAFGNDIHPSYLPFYHLRYSQDMSFFQRFTNYLFTRLDSFLKQTYERHRLEELAKIAFGDDVAPARKTERHISLLLTNINMFFHPPQPLTPNIIPVGGAHIKATKALPKDLKTIMDNARHGVILFCLGTNVRSDRLNVRTREALLTAFARMQQIVIWKYESRLKNVPENVFIRRFVPQSDILAHPNIKLFIGHGGALSSLEAAYFGVPVIGMPFFVDQRTTVNLIADRKLGLKMDHIQLTPERVFSCVQEILNNPIYGRNMKDISKRMRDQPITPLESAVFWLEYSIRHNGTHFLNPTSRDMPLFASSSTDVVLFLMLIALFGIFLFIYALKRIAFKILVPKPKRKYKLN